jgi:restriction endonuclease Mrr
MAETAQTRRKRDRTVAPADRKKRGRPEGEAEDPDEVTTIAIQATKRYRRFVNGVASSLRTTQSGAFDRIFADWCERNGYGTPPPRV